MEMYLVIWMNNDNKMTFELAAMWAATITLIVVICVRYSDGVFYTMMMFVIITVFITAVEVFERWSRYTKSRQSS
jgi:hypothetical protein